MKELKVSVRSKGTDVHVIPFCTDLQAVALLAGGLIQALGVAVGHGLVDASKITELAHVIEEEATREAQKQADGHD